MTRRELAEMDIAQYAMVMMKMKTKIENVKKGNIADQEDADGRSLVKDFMEYPIAPILMISQLSEITGTLTEMKKPARSSTATVLNDAVVEDV